MLADLNDTLSHSGAKHAIENRILTNASTQQQLSNSLIRDRQQTADYTPPRKTKQCTSNRVTHLTQHITPMQVEQDTPQEARLT